MGSRRSRPLYGLGGRGLGELRLCGVDRSTGLSAGTVISRLRGTQRGGLWGTCSRRSPTDNWTLMIWLVGIKYKSLEWPNGLARASRQSVRVAVRIPMNTRVATLGVNLLPSLRRNLLFRPHSPTPTRRHPHALERVNSIAVGLVSGSRAFYAQEICV
jgi:hypothetical protein